MCKTQFINQFYMRLNKFNVLNNEGVRWHALKKLLYQLKTTVVHGPYVVNLEIAAIAAPA